MKNRFWCFISFLLPMAVVDHVAHAQVTVANPIYIEDTSLGPKPTIKEEILSPAGHCDNRQVSFFAPWADHYEISKRRCDTAWMNERKYNNAWFTDKLKPGVTGIIYKRLDEQGTYQFVVRAYKGNRYRNSDTLTAAACIGR